MRLFTSKSTHTILWLIVWAAADDDDDDDVDTEADISAGFCRRRLENETLAVWWRGNELRVDSARLSLLLKEKPAAARVTAAARCVHEAILLSAAIQANFRSEVS